MRLNLTLAVEAEADSVRHTLKYQGNLSIQTSLLLQGSMSVTLHNGI